MSLNLVDLFAEFNQGKEIERPALVRVMKDVFQTLIRKKYGSDENFDVIVNTQKGDLELWRVRNIVPDGEVTDENSEIAVSEASEIDEDYEVGEECYEPVYLESFGRRAIMAARQTLISRIMDLEKDEKYRYYVDRIGEIIYGEIGQIMKREFLVVDDSTSNELIMPRAEVIRGDFFHKGDMTRGVIKEVEMRNNNPTVILSRASDLFLEKLLEQEVPEIEEGMISIKKIVRIPGERAKVAVESFDDRIDPVGACVGMKGSRIHGIVRELNNENIDIIQYTANEQLFIQRSLTPAKVSSIELDEENKHAKVYLEGEEVSRAIGKGGTNIKLASMLTGYEIDVFRNNMSYEEIEDIELDEFSDEIQDWILLELKGIGCDTARSVLRLSRSELVRRTDLEEETIDDVLSILASEFEEDDSSKNAPAQEEATEEVEATEEEAPALETTEEEDSTEAAPIEED